MSRYTVLIDGEAGAYGAVVPDMPGCAAMGDTLDAAIAGVADAMRDWAEVVEGRGEAVPAPRSLEALRADAEVAAALADGAKLLSAMLVCAS